MARDASDYLLGLWQRGQEHLVAGRYGLARRELEGAEAVAWRRRDARSLARIYLPLLEVRRLIRYQAADGVVLTSSRAGEDFLKLAAGTLFLTGPGSLAQAQRVAFAARRSGRSLEALILLQRGAEVRVVSPGDARFTAGLRVRLTMDATMQIGASTDEDLVVPLPMTGKYVSGALHGMARESIVIAWEALALKWQRRHGTKRGAGEAGGVGWAEMAWLRRALAIDPACEPVSMRLIAVAEGIERMTT